MVGGVGVGQKTDPGNRELGDNVRQPDIRVTGVPRGKGRGRKELFEEIMSMNFPKLMR